MTARQPKRRPAKRVAAPVTRLPFQAEHREIFRMAGDDWTPPADIVVRHGVRSWTLKAEFILPDGGAVTLTTRLAKRKSGVVRVDESMKLAFTARGTR